MSAHLAEFSELPVWQPFAPGWQTLAGGFKQHGFSFEWHDFTGSQLNWGSSFHPMSLEICLNIEGNAKIESQAQQLDIGPSTSGFYCRGNRPIQASRCPDDHHKFLTIELSRAFLRQHFQGREHLLHPLASRFIQKTAPEPGATAFVPMTPRQRELTASLQRPPVAAVVHDLWYYAKAVEAALEFLLITPEFFCVRQRRAAERRIDQVKSILRDRLSEPPSLDAIGKQVGCSPFYLSRLFSKETGMTIPQYLRQVRMEKAAALLKSGKFNVTEAALEVGYSSLSHFSQAFCQTIGCCPNLYAVMPERQQPASA